MIGFAVLAAAIYGVGDFLTTFLWRRLDGAEALRETTPLERASYAATLGISLWLAANWVFALTGTFTRAAILATAIAFVLAAAVVSVRSLRGITIRVTPWSAALIPIALWLVFILWRGSVLPPDGSLQ